MDYPWTDLAEPHERLRWTRKHHAKFAKPTDAAKALRIRPGTYRTYELSKADGGRWPEPGELRRICEKLGASWTWVLTGEGSPFDGTPGEAQIIARELAERVSELPKEKKEDALRAVRALLESYRRRAA